MPDHRFLRGEAGTPDHCSGHARSEDCQSQRHCATGHIGDVLVRCAVRPEHFARRGLKVEVKQIVADDIDITNAILSHAADSAADFIVMGGYGR